MKTIWSQVANKVAIECYNKAVDAEICCPSEPGRAFRGYYVAALLGNKDAALHVAIAFDVGHGIKRSEKLARMWYKIFRERT